MHEDLREACLAALKIDRKTARAHAEKFSWRAATEQFVSHLRISKQPDLATAAVDSAA
jgi:hypothetical protein